MDADGHGEEEGTAPGTGTGRRLLVHALAYLALLLALLAVTDRRVGWTLDDGAYATQVRVLEETGDWAYPYRHRDRDPTSRYAPVYLATTTADATYPYTKLPGWIEVLRASTRVFGDPIGFYVPSVIGALLAAWLAGLLAERLQPGTATLGFWAVAVGPIVVHATALWAHAVAAALGGAIALLLVALAEGRERRWHPFALAVLVVTLVAIRNEGLLFGAAASIVAGSLALARPGPPARRLARAAAWGGPALGAGLVARVATARWAAHLAPGTVLADPGLPTAEVGFVGGRIDGALRTLVDGLGASRPGTVLAVLAVVLAVVGGALLARRRDRAADGAVLVAASLGLALVRTVVVAPDDLGGLLMAVPLVAAAVGAWRWSTQAPVARALGALVALHLAAVLATQYVEGGSRDWGGRFLFPALVPLTVLAVEVLRPLVPTGRVRTPRVAPAALLAASLLPTLAGLRVVAEARASNRAFADQIEAVEAEVPTVIGVPRYLVRTTWDGLPERDRLATDAATADEALARLRPGRTEPVAVVGNGADQVRAPGYRRAVRSPVVVIFTPA